MPSSYKVYHQSDSLTVTITRPKTWYLALLDSGGFLSGCFATSVIGLVWLVLVITVWRGDEGGTNADGLPVGYFFLLFFLPVILGMGLTTLYMLYLWMWDVAGKETIKMSSYTLSITQEMLGFRRRKEYNLKDIENLRVLSKKSNYFNIHINITSGLGFVLDVPEKKLAFDYPFGTCRFGKLLGWWEANEVFKILEEYFSKYRKI